MADNDVDDDDDLLVSPETDWDDRDFVLAAVGHSGLAIRHASERLKADRDVVFRAVRQNGRALKFASDDLLAIPSKT